MLIHAKFGCETIVEDYVTSKSLKDISTFASLLTIFNLILSNSKLKIYIKYYFKYNYTYFKKDI